MAKLLNKVLFLFTIMILTGCQSNSNEYLNDDKTPSRGDNVGKTLCLEDGSSIKTKLIEIDKTMISFTVATNLKSEPCEPRFYLDAFGYCNFVSLDVLNVENQTLLSVKFEIEYTILAQFEEQNIVASWCDFGLPKIDDIHVEKYGSDELGGFSYYSSFHFTWKDCTITENGIYTKKH